MKSNEQTYRVILSGGGTGGHIYPAISIAKEFQKRNPNAAILFVGAKDKMEMQKVPHEALFAFPFYLLHLQTK